MPRPTRWSLLAVLVALPAVAPFHAAPRGIIAPPQRARRAAAPCLKAPEYIFEVSPDRTRIKFGCRQQTVTMVKPEAEGSLQDFVASSSDVMVMSSWDAGQVRRVEGEDDIYCIKVEEFNFVALRFEVELTVRCTLDERTTTASLESLGFRLIGPGLERLADVIDVTVSGKLRPTAPEARICALNGYVEFVASGELPEVLRPVPEAAIQAAAKQMSELLIRAAAERFGERVPKAYAKWARDRAAA